MKSLRLGFVTRFKKLFRRPEPAWLRLTASSTSLSIAQGANTTVVLTCYPTAYTGFVTATVSGLPTGVTSSVTNFTAPQTGVMAAVMTISVAADATPVTNDAFTVTVSGANSLQSTPLACTVTVTAVAVDAITLSLDNNGPTVAQSGTVDINATITRINGYSGTVTLSVAGLPSGVTESFPSGATLSGGTLTKPIRFTATGGAPVVTNDAVVVTASGSGVTAVDVNATVTVTASGNATPFKFDDMAYADTAALLAQDSPTGKYLEVQGTGSGVLSIDPTVQYGGHNTLRYRFSNATGSGTPRIVTNGIGLTGDAWYMYRLKWSPGFCNIINNGYLYAKAHKLNDFGFVGQQGRILSAITNGSGTPGGGNNNGDFQWETQTKTNAGVFLNTTMRKVISGASSLYQDGLWYQQIVHFQRVGANHYRVRSWFHEDGQTPTLLATINARDGYHTAPTGLGELQFPCTFNALAAGAPGVGVDQSVWQDGWRVYAGADDPFGLGTDGDNDVDISLSIDNASVSVAAGATATRTITASWEAGLTGTTVYLNKIGSTGENVFSTAQSQPSDSLVAGMTITVDKLMTAASPTATLSIATTGACAPGVYTRHVVVASTQRTGKGVASYSLPITVTVT